MATKTFFNFDRNLVIEQAVRTAFGRLASSMYALYVLELKADEKAAGIIPTTIKDFETQECLDDLIPGALKRSKKDLIALNMACKPITKTDIIGYIGDNGAIYSTLADVAAFAGNEFSEMETLFRERAKSSK